MQYPVNQFSEYSITSANEPASPDAVRYYELNDFSFGSFTVELKYFRSMPWYKAIFLSNFFNFTLVLFRTLWYNRVG